MSGREMPLTEESFLLLLLEAAKGSLESETRLQKLAFLGIKEGELNKFTNFTWEKYGPLSKEMWKTLRKMKRQGLLRILEEQRITSMGDMYAIRTFELTDKGATEVPSLISLHEKEYNSIRRVFSEYGNLPLDRLLDYVHSAYSASDL
jgi:uncharacterized protein YwgA